MEKETLKKFEQVNLGIKNGMEYFTYHNALLRPVSSSEKAEFHT